MSTNTAGYAELEHTADWELAVWAEDLAGLFDQAWRGMLYLGGVCLHRDAPVHTYALTLQADDAESLLASFLNELLFYIEQYAVAPVNVHLHTLTHTELTANLNMQPIASQEKYMKAVTYHALRIRTEDALLRVNLIIDV